MLTRRCPVCPVCMFVSCLFQLMTDSQKRYEVERHALFFKEEACKELYKDHVKYLVNRVNTINGEPTQHTGARSAPVFVCASGQRPIRCELLRRRRSARLLEFCEGGRSCLTC